MKTVHTAEHTLANLTDLHRLATTLAPWFLPGDVVTLDGPLGAGKTTTAQAMAKALGIVGPVTSPTFALLQRYSGERFPLVHVDLYRLGPEGACTLDGELEDILSAREAVLLVEWACYSDWLRDEATLTLTYELGDHDARHLTLTSSRPLPKFD